MSESQPRLCMRCVVSGRVQGVYFRGATRDLARELGLTGYARNLADGRVEVVCCGPKCDVEALSKWLWEGPPASRVSSVRCQQLDYNERYTEFGVR
ncbi:MAG: acylphosphatase [Gammaproteobacteria bacterium]